MCIRDSLRTIDGFSVALLEDCGDKIDEAGKSHLQRIRAATQRMGTPVSYTHLDVYKRQSQHTIERFYCTALSKFHFVKPEALQHARDGAARVVPSGLEDAEMCIRDRA